MGILPLVTGIVLFVTGALVAVRVSWEATIDDDLTPLLLVAALVKLAVAVLVTVAGMSLILVSW